MVNAIRYVHGQGCELAIVSDANTYFIGHLLEKFGLSDCFPASSIYSNSGRFDEDGRFHLGSYHNQSIVHNCPLCRINICKGLIVDQIRRARHEKIVSPIPAPHSASYSLSAYVSCMLAMET